MGQKFQDSTALYQATWNSSTAQNTALIAYGWGYSTAITTIQVTGTVTPGVLSFQGWDGYNWYTLAATNLSTGANATTWTLDTTSPALGSDMTGFSKFQVVLSTAITGSGSVLVTINESAAPLSALVAGGGGSGGGGSGGGTTATQYDGQVTVKTTAVQISSTSHALTNGIIIKAPSTNAADIYVGLTGVTTTTGDLIEPGEARGYTDNNLNLRYIISASSTTDIITYSAS